MESNNVKLKTKNGKNTLLGYSHIMKKNKPYNISERAYEWSKEVIDVCELLPEHRLGRIIYNQLVRSSTSVSANSVEADSGLSRKDFIKCLGISLKECNESNMWLRLIIDKKLISRSKVQPLQEEAVEISKIFASIILKAKRKT